MDEEKKTTYPEDYNWFALGAPYRNESKTYDELTRYGIKAWVPLVKILEVSGNKRKWVTKPVVGNLLFAYTSEKELRRVKPFIPKLQFKIFTEEGVNKKVIVPEDQMENFILFVNKLSDVPAFVDPAKLNLKAGNKVKVVSGPLEGIVGTFVKVKGHRSKMLCVTLGSIGSSIVEISPENIVVLETRD